MNQAFSEGGESATGMTARERQAPVDLCLSSRHFYPAYAGPAVRFRRYAPGLAERGVSMKVFTVGEEGGDGSAGGKDLSADVSPGRDPGAKMVRDRIDGIPVCRLMSTGQEVPDARQYFEGLVEFCHAKDTRPDVLQLLEIDPSVTPWLWRLNREGIPMVYTQTMVNPMSERWWKRALQKLYWPLPYRLVDCVVVSSGVMRQDLRRIGVTGRIEVIPNGVDVGHFSPLAEEQDRADLRKELGLPPAVPVLVYIGSISPRKGIDVLAEAWERLAPRYDRCRLVLVGPRHDEIRPDEEVGDFFERVDSALERSGARDRVIFTGAVDDVRPYLQAADLFVFPSRREGMPNVVPEAYACGLPTVMAPFIGLPEEFGEPGEHFVLVDHDPREMARAIESLLDDPSRRRELGRSARQLAATDHPIQRSLDKYAALYRDLAKS